MKRRLILMLMTPIIAVWPGDATAASLDGGEPLTASFARELVVDELDRASMTQRDLADALDEQYCGGYLLGTSGRPRSSSTSTTGPGVLSSMSTGSSTPSRRRVFPAPSLLTPPPQGIEAQTQKRSSPKSA